MHKKMTKLSLKRSKSSITRALSRVNQDVHFPWLMSDCSMGLLFIFLYESW